MAVDVLGITYLSSPSLAPLKAVRSALDLDPGVPVVLCDARQRSSARDVLIAVIEHARRELQRARAAGTNV